MTGGLTPARRARAASGAAGTSEVHWYALEARAGTQKGSWGCRAAGPGDLRRLFSARAGLEYGSLVRSHSPGRPVWLIGTRSKPGRGVFLGMVHLCALARAGRGGSVCSRPRAGARAGVGENLSLARAKKGELSLPWLLLQIRI